MVITFANNIKITDPSPMLMYEIKKKLTIPNPEFSKKLRMGFYLGNTPRNLCLYEIRGNDVVIPFGCLRWLRQITKNDTSIKWVNAFELPQKCDYKGTPINLYDYQEKAVNELKKASYGILQSKAGSGKTQMGVALIKDYGVRALWITHTKDLLNQSKERAERYIDHNLIGTITGGKVNIGKGVTFATVQTLSKLDLSQYTNEWDVIIVDECHRAISTPTAVSTFGNVLNSLAARHKYGLSATVHRADGMIEATFSLLGNVVYAVPDKAVADKVMPVDIYPVGTDFTLTVECLNTDGTLNYSSLINEMCKCESRNHTIIEVLEQNRNRPCLVLSDRLEHLAHLINLLPSDMEDKAVMISGKMKSKVAKEMRNQALEDMRTGKKKYLFATYSLAKEGLDIPCLERLFLTTPQTDYAVITQSIGRVARVSEGKTEAIAYDFVDTVGYLIKAYKKRCTTYRKEGCKIHDR